MVKKKENEKKHDCCCGNECNCKKTKKSTGLIISLIVIVLVFCVGLGVGTFILEDGFLDKCVDVQENKNSKDEYIVKLFNEKSENYKDISLKNEEDIEKFLYSIDNSNEIERKAMLTNYNTNYVESFLIGYVLYSFYTEGNYSLHFSTSFLESEVDKVFASRLYSLNNSAPSGSYMDMGYNIMCENELCVGHASYSGYGSGPHYEYKTEIITINTEESNIVYTLKDYYIWLEHGANGEDLCNIYTEENGELLIKNFCPESYEELITKVNPDELNTYEMIFDKDNRYVSSKKIN